MGKKATAGALTILAVMLAVGFGLWTALDRFYFQEKTSLEQRRAAAIPATATIKGLGQSVNVTFAFGSAKFLKLHLAMEVSGPKSAKRQAEVDWYINQLFIPQVQPGAKIAVRVDAEDPSRIYPAPGWAAYGIVDIFTAR